MKTKSALLLIALALASYAQADTGIQPFGSAAEPTAPVATGNLDQFLKQGITPKGLTTDPLGCLPPEGQARGSDPKRVPTAALNWLAGIVEKLPANGSLRLSDLFLNPEFFAAAHAAGPEADALRGQIDWLMLTGVILGFDGMDGSDDLTGDAGDDLRGSDDPDEIFGESSKGIILGGPGSDNIILGGPGTDTLAIFNPSIILGGPGSDNIILGGPGSDNIKAPINGFVFGTTSYLQPAPLNWSWGETNFFTDILVSGAVQSPVNGIILGGPGTDTMAPNIVNGFVFGTTSYLK